MVKVAPRRRPVELRVRRVEVRVHRQARIRPGAAPRIHPEAVRQRLRVQAGAVLCNKVR
jgi:hypothetical protein